MTHDFLLATWEGGGNVPPVIGTARRLRARGHRVRVLGDEAMRRDMESAGATFIPWKSTYNQPDRRPETDPLRDWEAPDAAEGLVRVLDRIMMGPAADYAADTIGALRQQPADVVVSCDLMFGPMIGAQATGTPLAVLAPNVSLMPLPGLPPLGPGIAPPTNDEERAIAQGAAQWFADRLAERLPALNAVRARYGLPALNDAADQSRGADLTLLATSPAFDFPVESMPQGSAISDRSWSCRPGPAHGYRRGGPPTRDR